ncbi:MAG: tetratricopeptide repeat protein [Acidobacteria bacterium]|nr:tetratricopeptide repeat protein [Acidobacteriota bacterium]MBI3656456.1 tetratricopeptide repeat protein [Acidobacteriota bacterium]
MPLRRNAFLPCLFLLVIYALPGLSAGASPAPDDLTQLDATMSPRLEAGVKFMLDGYYEKAIAIFSQLEKEYPESPVGLLRRAETLWWKILKLDGDFNRLHEMDVLKSNTPPFEKEFNAAVEKAIRLSEALVKKYKTHPQAYFSLGIAYGLKSQMEGGKDNTIAAAKSAKKMKQNLDKCLSLDPNFADAFLEAGLYNYHMGSLPPVQNMAKFMIGLPSGDKKKGIELVKMAAAQDGLQGAEAKFYLAAIYSGPEIKKYQEAIALITDLRRQFPNNPIFHLLLGHLYEKQGKWETAKSLYWDIIRTGQGRHENYDESIVREAHAGMSRGPESGD